MQFLNIALFSLVAIAAALPNPVPVPTNQMNHATTINNGGKPASTYMPRNLQSNLQSTDETTTPAPTCKKETDTCLTMKLDDGKDCTISCPDKDGVYSDQKGKCVTLHDGPKQCCIGLCG